MVRWRGDAEASEVDAFEHGQDRAHHPQLAEFRQKATWFVTDISPSAIVFRYLLEKGVKRCADGIKTVREEATAWGDDVNDNQRGVDRQVQTDDILESAYPGLSCDRV